MYPHARTAKLRAHYEGTALTMKGMRAYALVQPPNVLHIVPAEPPKDRKLLQLSKRFGLRNEYVKNMLGLDDKPARTTHKSWQELESVRWLEHVKTLELVPVVGEIKEFLKSRRAKESDMSFNERSFLQFMSPAGKEDGSGKLMDHYKEWRRVELLPAEAASQLEIYACAQMAAQRFYHQSSPRRNYGALLPSLVPAGCLRM